MYDKRMNLYDATKFENIRGIIRNSMDQYADNNAFIIKETKGKEIKYKNITYRQLNEHVDSLGTKFLQMGLKDKRIAIIGKNRYEWVVTYLATINGTGIVVPLDKGLPEQEIESSLERSQANVIVFEEQYSEMMEHIKENNKTNVTEYICMDKQEKYPYLYDLIKEGKELLDQGNREFLDTPISSEKMCILLFTSGTTSKSKAVMLSQNNIASNVYAMQLILHFYHFIIHLVQRDFLCF